MKNNEEAFNSWFEEERRLFEANEPATFTDSDEWCMKKGWIAACEYKDKEYSNLIDAMTRTSQNNARLSIIIENQKTVIEINQAENAKLRECVEFYADLDNEVDFYDSRGMSYARQVLKELE